VYNLTPKQKNSANYFNICLETNTFATPKQLSIYTFNKGKTDMTKAEIIAEISSKTGIEKVDVQETVEAFFKVVKSSMVSGENVYVRGFGSFVVKKRAKKTARNISKNTAIIIPEHFVPSFKPAKTFVEKVKSGAKKASK
jgi:DNA-binding protein HU-beta